MINFYYKGINVGKITIDYLEKYFFKSLLGGDDLPIYSFLFPDYKDIEKWQEDFHFLNFQSFFMICKDKNVFAPPFELLFQAYKDEKEINLNWEELEKEEAWWYELNKMKSEGYNKFFDTSISDEYVEKKIFLDFKKLKRDRRHSKRIKIYYESKESDKETEEEKEFSEYKKWMEEYNILNFYYRNNFICSINMNELVEFLTSFGAISQLPPFIPQFFPEWWINIKQLPLNFYLIYSRVALILVYDNEWLVLEPIFLNNVLQSRRKHKYSFEEFEKKKAWWQRFNLMYDEGLYKFIDYSPILDKLDAIADKLISSERFFNKWFRYSYRSRYYFYHKRETIIKSKELINELRAKGGKI